MLKCKFKGCRKSQYGEPFVFDSAHRAVITKTIKLVRKQSWEGGSLHLFRFVPVWFGSGRFVPVRSLALYLIRLRLACSGLGLGEAG